MALINDILGRKKSSFYPVNEEELHEEAIKTPDIPETKASDQDNKQPADIIQPQPASDPWSKWNYPDEVKDHLIKNNITPERLEQLSSFDPSKGEGYAVKFYESTVPKPSEPDEKRIRNAKLVGSIADSLGLLSQMWSYGKGAHVEKRDNKNSASSQIDDQERNLRNIYLQQLNKYNDGLLNARMKDYQTAWEDYKNGRKEIGDILEAQRKASEFAAKQKFNSDKLAQDQANKDRDYEIKLKNNESLDRHRKSLEAQGWSRTVDSQNRTAAYVKRASGSGKNEKYQMIFAADPSDGEALTDNQLGARVRVFEMNKGEIDRHAREALSDTDFMKRHPELILQRPDMLGSGSYKYKPNADIAAAYLREQYEKGFAQSPETPTFQPYNWSQNLPPTWNPSSISENSEDDPDSEEDEGWAWID